jgi:S1-C subfamily serine protease
VLADVGDVATVSVTGPAAFASDEAIADEPGAVVVGVVPDGPAAKAGIVRGDIVLGAGGADVNDVHDIAVATERLSPGDALPERIRHGDEERAVDVTLGDRDGAPYLGVAVHPGGAPERPHLAVGRFEGSPMGRLALDLPLPHLEDLKLPEGVDRAAVIGSVEPQSPADAAGLEDGDIVTKVDGSEVASGDALAEGVAKHKPGDTVVLTIARPGDESPREVTVTLGANPSDPDKPYLGVRGLGMIVIEGASPGEALRDRLRMLRIEVPGERDDGETAPGKAGDTM